MPYKVYNKPIEQMDKTTQAVYQDLINGLDKKTVANKHKIKVQEVMTIAQRYNTGRKIIKPSAEQKELPALPVTMIITTEKVNETQENKKEEVEVSKKRKYHRKGKLNDEQILSLISDVEEQKLSREEIAKKYNVSPSYVSAKASEFGMRVKRIVKTQKPINSDNDLILIRKYTKNIECGLVMDRHDMPCKLYIFENVTNEDMFKYDELDLKVHSFINKYIKFNKGEPDAYISLYVTGLSCCLASVIKVCASRNVDLVLKHFDTSNKQYHEQIIFDSYSCIKLNQYIDLKPYKVSKTLYRCSNFNPNSLKVGDVYYDVTVCGSYGTINETTILCGSINDMFAVYAKEYEKCSKSKKPKTIYAHKMTCKNNSVVIDTITKSFDVKS